MPHFMMQQDQLNDLIAYLKRIGDDGDTDPGVSATSVRIGAAVPLSGPLKSAGESIRETLERLFAAASRNGGIYGRRIELVAEDSRGTVAGLRDATRRLIVEENVFALTASLEPVDSDESNQLLDTEGIPLVGPIALSPHVRDSPNRYVFYLLPSLYDQARAVVDFLAARQPQEPKLAVIYGATRFDQDVVDGLRFQASVHGLVDVVARQDNLQAIDEVLSSTPDYLVFSGDGAGLARVGKELEHADSAPVLIGFISTAQSGINLLPPSIAASALFVAPAFPPGPGQTDYSSVRGVDGSQPAYLGLRTAAFAGGTVLLQALRESGKRLNRDSLVRILEGLQHFETGLTPALSFGPDRRVGSSGCVMMAIVPGGRYLSMMSDWIVPQN
jgi:ABC-type branched-subunit amino acid transport system substrate-binding protein